MIRGLHPILRSSTSHSSRQCIAYHHSFVESAYWPKSVGIGAGRRWTSSRASEQGQSNGSTIHPDAVRGRGDKRCIPSTTTNRRLYSTVSMSTFPKFETAVIDDKGTKFAYIDSGAPGTNDYTTLVCVHGHTYNAREFRSTFYTVSL